MIDIGTAKEAAKRLAYNMAYKACCYAIRACQALEERLVRMGVKLANKRGGYNG